MCIAVYKPQGQKMPSKKILSNCFASNDDGAGFMFPLNGKVHYEKGFMSFNSFKKGLKACIKKTGISPKDIPMVFHFRITSQGGVKPTLTHPFPLCRSYDEMRKLSGDVDVACVHNGIIDFASSYNHLIDYSDTMEFIKEVAFPLIYKNPDYYKNKTLVGMLTYLLTGNRFAIMDSKGHVELIGSWLEDNGIYYSNTSYKNKPFVTTAKVSKGIFSRYDDGYDEVKDWNDSFGYSSDGFYYGGLITDEQEKLFLETGMLICDCGEEMLIEWDGFRGACYAYCFDCGMSFKLTKKAQDYAYAHGLVYDVVDKSEAYGGAY